MDVRDEADQLLFGRDADRAVRLSAAAGTLFLVAVVLHLPARFVGPLSIGGPEVTVLLLTAMALSAAAGAYLNDGLLVCIALAGGIGLGFYLPAVLFNPETAGSVTMWVLTMGSVTAVVLGVVGFVFGAAARRAVEG